jgi:hypothetical protein
VPATTLAVAEQRLLEYAFDEFNNTGEWPVSSLVELDLEEILDPHGGLIAVAHQLGHDQIRCERPDSDSARCRLTLRGIARCQRGERDVDLFLNFARMAGRKYRECRGRDARIVAQDLREHLGLDDAGISRLDALTRLEGRFWNSMGGGTYALNRFAARLTDVSSLDDYYARCTAFFERENSERESERLAWKAATAGTSTQSTIAGDDVFLSHAATDSLLADVLRAALLASRSELKVFVASRPGDIPPGEDWLDSIRGKLRAANTYVILVTPESLGRPWVWFETGAAWMSGKRVIPVVAGVAKGELPLPLSSYQAIDLCDPYDLRELASSLGGELRDAAGVCRIAEAILRHSAQEAHSRPNPPSRQNET